MLLSQKFIQEIASRFTTSAKNKLCEYFSQTCELLPPVNPTASNPKKPSERDASARRLKWKFNFPKKSLSKRMKEIRES